METDGALPSHYRPPATAAAESRELEPFASFPTYSPLPHSNGSLSTSHFAAYNSNTAPPQHPYARATGYQSASTGDRVSYSMGEGTARSPQVRPSTTTSSDAFLTATTTAAAHNAHYGAEHSDPHQPRRLSLPYALASGLGPSTTTIYGAAAGDPSHHSHHHHQSAAFPHGAGLHSASQPLPQRQQQQQQHIRDPTNNSELYFWQSGGHGNYQGGYGGGVGVGVVGGDVRHPALRDPSTMTIASNSLSSMSSVDSGAYSVSVRSFVLS